MQKTTWQVRVASKTLPRTSHRFMRGDPDLRRERVKDVITSLRRSCDCRIGKGSCDVVSSRFESLGFPKQNCMYLSSNPVYWCFLRLTTFSDWCSSASKLSWTKCCSDIRGPNCRRTAEINIAVRLLYSIFAYFFSSDTCISNDALNRFPSPFITTLRSQSLCTSIWNYILFGRTFWAFSSESWTLPIHLLLLLPSDLFKCWL